MRKIIILIMLVMAAFTATAEEVRYNVKYQNEWGNAQTTWYEVDTEYGKEEPKGIMVAYTHLSYNFEEIIDEDSDADDIAIVNKLDRQGYKEAWQRVNGKCVILYMKIDGVWHMYYGLKQSSRDEPVILGK